MTTARVETRPLEAKPGSASAPQSASGVGAGRDRHRARARPGAGAGKRAPPPAPREGDDDINWAWPATTPVSTPFDEARSKGLVFRGKPGDPVYAAADGRVVYAGSGLRGYGNLVILKHNTTYLTAYAHNQTLLVKDDQQVKRGQKIAEMGSTRRRQRAAPLRDPQAGQADRSGAPAAGALARSARRVHVDGSGPRLRHRDDPRHRRPAALRGRAAASDADVYAAEIADRAARNKSDFMPLYLQRVLVISLRLPRQPTACRSARSSTSSATAGARKAGSSRRSSTASSDHRPQLVSWNGGGFDLPVLQQRGLRHGVVAGRYWDMGDGRPRAPLQQLHQPLPPASLDLMDLLAMYQSRANAPLDAMAKLCGFPGQARHGRLAGLRRLPRGPHATRSAAIARPTR